MSRPERIFAVVLLARVWIAMIGELAVYQSVHETRAFLAESRRMATSRNSDVLKEIKADTAVKTADRYTGQDANYDWFAISQHVNGMPSSRPSTTKP